MERLREFLKFAGKGERKVVAVFADTRAAAEQAVAYLRREIPDLPIFLFASEMPGAGTASACERTVVDDDSMALLVTAEKELWPYAVALCAGTWTGRRGRWPVKLAPLAVPPFRAVLLNRAGDWFAGTPRGIARHAARTLRDRAHSAWNRAKDIHRGAWLWALGLIAKAALPVLRAAFHRRHGTETLALEAARSGEGVAIFRYAHRQWRRARLESLVRDSRARWIAFLDGEAEENFEDLLPWLAGEDAFAVSRQTGYRDWKPGLFTVAPFRQLQPGESSRTLAPVSNVTVVDRAKLAALGVPRTITPGAAWLLLFWRAAAAGWKSYSVGGARALRQIPDWPFEESEFVLRTLGTRVGPGAARLARGNVSCARPARTAGVGGKPVILLVSPYLPYPLSHGGAVRIYNLCRALSAEVDFILACFRETRDAVNYDKLHEVFREVCVVDRDERPVKDRALPRQVREHASAGMRALIAELAPRAQAMQVEFTHMATFRDAAPQLPAILVEHDVTFTLYRQYAEQKPARGRRDEYARWLAFEKHWLARYDAVWTMSEQDRATVVEGGCRAAFTVPNGVDTRRFLPAPAPSGAPEIFYIGSFRHRPNVIGFERLRNAIMPPVWERFPEAKLRVVAGPEPEAYWNGEPGGRTVLHGFVEDVRPLYAAASVVAVPLLVSAGTNLKVMEAMACGRAVVTTTVGCRGLGLEDGRDALIRDGDEEFAAAICDLLQRPEEAARIAANARRTVEARFGWDAIAREARASYARLVGTAAKWA